MIKKTVIRFTPSERWFHNVVMFTFVFLLITGLTMIVHNLLGKHNDSREFLSSAHKLMSLLFIAGPPVAFILGARSVWRDNIRILSSVSGDDVEWLMKKPLSSIIKGVDLPPEDKFNPGQKIWAFIAFTCSMILLFTGIFIWLFESAILALFIHSSVSFIMAMALSGHVFMALVNKDTRPGIGSIIDGEVDAEWAMRHHPLWMERLAKERVLEKVGEKEQTTSGSPTENVKSSKV